MKSTLMILIAVLVVLGAAAGGLWSRRGFVSNYENAEYDPEGNFLKPSLVVDGLAVYQVGEGDPILVFPYPHAGTSQPMAQSDFAQVFTTLGRKVITFDVPGTYASTRDPRVDMAEMLECALQALEASGIEGEVDVAGHSMGGLAALAFALEHPERVNRLLLVNTLSGFEASLEWGLPKSAWSWTQIEYWQLIYWGLRLNNGMGNLEMHKRLMNLMHEVSFHDHSKMNPLEIDADDASLATPVRFKWSNAVWNINYAPALGEITAPSLITAGSFDAQTPLECARELADGIPDNQLLIFENSGHFPFIEEQDRFLEAVREFLEG